MGEADDVADLQAASVAGSSRVVRQRTATSTGTSSNCWVSSWPARTRWARSRSERGVGAAALTRNGSSPPKGRQIVIRWLLLVDQQLEGDGRP